ncbi:MAG: hypothetical protein ACE5KX_01640 [Acidimicrobiia bacterium]
MGASSETDASSEADLGDVATVVVHDPEAWTLRTAGPDGPRQGPRPARLIIAAAFVAGLALGYLIGSSTAGSDTLGSGERIAVPEPAVAGLELEVVSTPFGEMTWTRLVGSRALDGTDMRLFRQLDADDSGFVAIAGTDLVASTDGISWAAVRVPGPVRNLAVMASGLLAVGEETVVTDEGQHISQPILWISSNGLSWTEARLDQPAPVRWSVQQLVAGDAGLLLLGRAPATAQTWVWTSTDGRSFERGPDFPFELSPRLARQPTVISAGEGFVAIVPRFQPFTPAQPEVWFSGDGRDWTAAPPGVLADGSAVVHVAGYGGRYVAVGRSQTTFGEPASPRAWTSDDGATWTEVPQADADFAPGSVLQSVDGGELGWVIFGSDERGPVLWLSRDGRRWERLPSGGLFDEFFVSRSPEVAVGGSGLVVSGGPAVDGSDILIGTLVEP